MNYENESSQDKQKRINCGMGWSVSDWNCYKDCAFWNGKECTYNDEKQEEEE